MLRLVGVAYLRAERTWTEPRGVPREQAMDTDGGLTLRSTGRAGTQLVSRDVRRRRAG